MTLAATRHWPLPDTHNIRDLGGYARSTGGMTQWGRILRGDALHELTQDSIASLVDSGLTLVIDLRGPHETGATSHPFRDHGSVTYRNIALFDALGPIAMTEAPFDMAQRYRNAVDTCGPRLVEALRAIATARPGIVLFHCTAGKDRTGIIAALLLRLAGVAEVDIAADYALTAEADGLISKLRERAMQTGADPDHIARVLASDEATIVAMLDHIDTRYGGIDRYLMGLGLSGAELALLADRLCA